MITLFKKTGFYSPSTIAVFDMVDGGKLFYCRTIQDGVHFNLPIGTYDFDGVATELSHPIRFKYKRMPRLERHYKLFKPEIVIKKTPNKAFIVLPQELIVISPEFCECPVIYNYIISHELGHYKYKTEKFADRFAYNRMIYMGFNPTQIVLAATRTLNILHQSSRIRLKDIFSYAKK